MRILFSSTAGVGHFRPLLPFATASAAAGHEVAVTAPRSFAEHVAETGYPFLPFADIEPAVLKCLHESAATDPEVAARFDVLLFAGLAPRAALPGVRAAIESFRPDLVVRDTAELASLVAAESFGIPEIAQVSSVQGFVRPLHELTFAALRELGLRAAPPAAASLSLFPSSFDPAAEPPVVHRFRGPKAPARVGSERPLIYLTYGTVASGDAGGAAALRANADALSTLAADVVVSTAGSDPALWRGVAPNVHPRSWVEEDEVLPRASVVVCHGGAGTTLGALRAGVPVVAVPQFADQPAIGAAVEASGTGLRLGGGRPSPEDLRAAVDRLLTDPSFRRRATAVAAEIAALPPVEQAVPLFERLVAQRISDVASHARQDAG